MHITCDQLKTNLRQICNHFSKSFTERLANRRINIILFSDNTHV